MWWVLFAVSCAFGQALMEACAKRAIDAGNDRQIVLGIRFGLAGVALLPLLIFARPPSNPTFWLMHLYWIPLELAAALLLVRAVQISPLSLTLPYIAFTPAFLLLIEGVFTDTWAGPLGAGGVAFIIVGSYVLNLGSIRHRWDWIAPLRAAASEPGTRIMLLVALIYSVTALTASQLTALAGPWYFSWHFPTVVGLALIPFCLPALKARRPIIWHWSLPVGAAGLALMSVTNMLAFDLSSHVVYVIAIKRLSVVFGVLFGWLIFAERHWGIRLVGAIFMAGGAACIIIEDEFFPVPS